jgi:DNA replicative helicase MCM subunit Mcm2 (Cdc46/Mcm family)
MPRTIANTKFYGDVNKTAIVETRCDVRSLAGIYRYMKKHGVYARSKSDLARQAIDTYYVALIEAKAIEPVEDFDEAYAVLTELGITSRDMKAMKHISALVNKMDFNKTVCKEDIPVHMPSVRDQVGDNGEAVRLSEEAAKPFELPLVPPDIMYNAMTPNEED